MRAIEAGQARNIEIEVLRAIAIICLVVADIPLNLFYWRSGLGLFEDSYWNGNFGADLFMAISGYVIALTLLPKLTAADEKLPFLAQVLTFLINRFLAPESIGLAMDRSGDGALPHIQ